MANALWADGPPNSIHETSDILVVMIGWSQNGKRELWKLDQKIVIDRYMTKNVAWAMNIRAKTSVAKGNARRWKEKIDRLTTRDVSSHNGCGCLRGKADIVGSQHRDELEIVSNHR